MSPNRRALGRLRRNFVHHGSTHLRAALVLIVGGLLVAAMQAGSTLPNPLNSRDSTGTLSTYNNAGGIDLSNVFFQNLGTNGRSCGTCHVAQDAWTVTPPDLQARFRASQGTDPIFRPVDGANCPSADVSSVQARRRAYSQLLNKGLIRISLSVPDGAEFSIQDIRDPYDCPETTEKQPAMYRRPLPAVNLPFLSTVMWDGRETVTGAIPGKSINLNQSLTNQAFDATMGHAQAATPPTPQQLAAIVAFEIANFTAQASDNRAGSLNAKGAQGGPQALSNQPFHVGINDSLGGDPTGAAFNPLVFTIYNAWSNLHGANATAARQSLARGQALFNTYPIAIRGVGGLNDALRKDTIQGTCTTCHDSPNVGNHSFSVPLNIGTTAYPAVPALDISGLPVYTIECKVARGDDEDNREIQTTDPGRALISGKCADIGKVKGPVLRGLAGRAPYFHNGAAATLNHVVEFYDQRFNLNLTDQQKADLVAFLQTL
jgi:cytochrome c peroxidase